MPNRNLRNPNTVPEGSMNNSGAKQHDKHNQPETYTQNSHLVTTTQRKEGTQATTETTIASMQGTFVKPTTPLYAPAIAGALLAAGTLASATTQGPAVTSTLFKTEKAPPAFYNAEMKAQTNKAQVQAQTQAQANVSDPGGPFAGFHTATTTPAIANRKASKPQRLAKLLSPRLGVTTYGSTTIIPCAKPNSLEHTPTGPSSGDSSNEEWDEKGQGRT